MSSNESEDFEDPETEQTQVYQSDQDEMHFYQDEKVKEVKTVWFVSEFQAESRKHYRNVVVFVYITQNYNFIWMG